MCGGLFYVIEELRVKNIIIGKQTEISKNYKDFIEIAEKKNINIYIVNASMKLNVDNNVYFDIIWPCENDSVNDNILNNNAIVCKINYKEFSMLFTGDIEEVAENKILEKYKDKLKIFNSTVLKVAHHGSKTSSNKEFLKYVKPKIALIGVGKDNSFGHPADITLENLENMGCKIYRTDKNGEISLETNGENISVDYFIK